MEFTTQKELLEYLGKNPEDRHLIQRMIIRWEVYKVDWMYHYVQKKDLYKENEMLRERIKELEEKGWEKSDSVDSEEVAELRRMLAEAESNLEYQINAYDELAKWKWMKMQLDKVLKKCYDKMAEREAINPKELTFPQFRIRAMK